METTDQLGNTLTFAAPPQRIVSLVPSQTEFLFDIGLDKEIAGVTRFCIHPTGKVEGKEKIGGTKRFNFEKIKSLQPDLIIGNKEENYEEGIEQLQKDFPVWMSDIYQPEDAYKMMQALGNICNKGDEATALVHTIKKNFAELTQQAVTETAAYFIWRKPYMVAAKDTFIDSMLGIYGVKNAFSHLHRYPEIEPDILSLIKPTYIFLSSEPYAFSEKHFDEFKSFSPESKVVVVDGEMFSWYGSRLKLAAAYFADLRQLIKS